MKIILSTKIPGKFSSPGYKIIYHVLKGKDYSLCFRKIFNFGQTPPAKHTDTCVIPDNDIGNLSKIVFSKTK